MLLESLARILSIYPACFKSASGRQFCRMLISSSNKCLSSMTTPNKETNTLPGSLASLREGFLDAVKNNDSRRAHFLRQKLRESSNDRRVLKALGRAISICWALCRLSP